MQLNIRKGLLAEIFSGMAKLLSHSGYGVLIKSAPGKVRAVGTNLMETFVYEAESPEIGEGALVLPTDQLKEIVSAYGTETIINFTELEGGDIRAAWTTKGLSTNLTFRSEGEFPEIKIPAGNSYKPLDRERFLAEYLLCAECTAQERARFDLECIMLDGKNNKMIATDGRQVYEASGFEFPWRDICYLPTGRNFPEKLFLSSGDLEAAKTNEVLAFRNGPWTYSVERKDANFPPIEELKVDIADTGLFLVVSEEDVARILELLPHLPGNRKPGGAVTLKASEGLTFCAESKGMDGTSEGEFALASSHWIGGPCQPCFSRSFFIRALKHGFRMFRFLPGNTPIVCETETGKYMFMPMTIRDEESSEEVEEESRLTPRPKPAEVRKWQTKWLKREAYWLAAQMAEEVGYISPSASSPIMKQISFQLESVMKRLSELADKLRKHLTLQNMLPPQDQPTWEEVGNFARANGAMVTLVRSEDGFFSIRSGEAVNLTAEDVSEILEPLLSRIWKPCCLALYYNGQRWWIDAEHAIIRKGKKAQRRLIVGEPRPASKEYIEWEIGVLQKLLEEAGTPVPPRSQERANRRLEKLRAWLNQVVPETLDLLPLCLVLPATA